MKEKEAATYLNLFGNAFLFAIKLFAGIVSGSIAVLSDAMNSLTDILASAIVFIAVKVAGERADAQHPFGHERAETIAGLVVAVFIATVGLEIAKDAFAALVWSERIIREPIAIYVLLITIATKAFMHVYVRRVAGKTNNVALLASAEDHRNDVLISTTALVGVSASMFGVVFADALAALIISVWIIRIGLIIGLKNTGLLIGEAPKRPILQKIELVAKDIVGVKRIHDVRAQFLGTRLHVELHIDVDKRISMMEGHRISKQVQKRLEELEEIDRAFVHLDPR